MESLMFIMVITVMYCLLLFFDLFFKSCMHYPYDAFIKNTGLSIQFMRLRWHTTAFNRTIFKLGTSCSKVFINAFNFGVLICLILMVVAVVLFSALLLGLTQDGGNEVGSKKFNVQVQLLLPGVNLPVDELGYYIAVLLMSSVVHELGHAVAAVMEDVAVTGFGVYVFFCFPIAYTELNTEQLNALRPLRKLRILCAGVFHNVLLAVLFFTLFIGLGPVLTPFYESDSSVIITDISKQSHLRGERGLFRYDVLLAINDCHVKNLESWQSCLVKSLRDKPGLCVSSEFIRLNDETGLIAHIDDGLVQCCDKLNSKMMCFEYVNDIRNDDPLEIPQHMCLDIRKTIEASTDFCSTGCDDGFCIRPVMNNSTTLLVISRHNKDRVIYIGHPSDLYRTIELSGFVPKTKYLSPKIADGLSLFLKYTVVLSLGLAVVNAIPGFSLDGYHIASTIINTVLVIQVPDRTHRELILLAISSMGTMLLFSSISKVLWFSLTK